MAEMVTEIRGFLPNLSSVPEEPSSSLLELRASLTQIRAMVTEMSKVETVRSPDSRT
jgi:hypothetical protein